MTRVDPISDALQRAEAAALSREKQLRFVTDHLPVLIVQCDAHCRYTFVNAPYANRFGLDADAVIGRSIADVLGQPAWERIRPHVEAALRGERTEFEVQIPYNSLGPRWMHCVYVPQVEAGDEVTGFVGLISDVTERHEADQAIQEQATRLEVLNQVGSTLTAEPRLENVVQYVTDAATQLTGAQFGAFFYNVRDAERGDAYMLYALSGAPREAFERFGMPRNTAVFGPTFAGKGIVRLDDVTQDARYGLSSPHHGMPAGHLPVRSYLAVPVISRSGEVLGGLFFGHGEPARFNDAAERIVAGIAAQAAVAIDNARLHEQSERLIRQLREADRRKDEFIATLSHELRNPLAPLRNALHLLRLQGADIDGPLANVHGLMERQVNHLVRLVDDLLEMSRISRGVFELRSERLALAAVVQGAVDSCMPLLRDAGHTLALDLPPEPLWVQGDPVRLAQIVGNLLNNAARYTPAGGRIQVSARSDEGQAVVSVRDNGQGFEPEAAERMFEMFSRGPQSNGLGIGLALSRSLATMHGGTLAASSAGPGQGAEFSLRLPIAEAPAEAQGAPAPASPMAALRILVADDNQDAGDTLEMLLTHLGAQVRVVRNGADALAEFQGFDPDVVLLDIGMPGMDGYETARAIRARHAGHPAALVALTGWGQEQDRQRSREAGFDHHLVKPADIEALQALLAQLAGTSGVNR